MVAVTAIPWVLLGLGVAVSEIIKFSGLVLFLLIASIILVANTATKLFNWNFWRTSYLLFVIFGIFLLIFYIYPIIFPSDQVIGLRSPSELILTCAPEKSLLFVTNFGLNCSLGQATTANFVPTSDNYLISLQFINEQSINQTQTIEFNLSKQNKYSESKSLYLLSDEYWVKAIITPINKTSEETNVYQSKVIVLSKDQITQKMFEKGATFVGVGLFILFGLAEGIGTLKGIFGEVV